MKNILLSSAAVALLAGAASAEVTWSGDAEIGYNDDYEDGAYWDAGLYVNLSQELNNGWTVTGALDIDLEDDDADTGSSAYDLGSVSTSDWVLTLSNDMFTFSAGDIDTAMASFDYVTGLFAATDALDDAFGIDTLSDDSSDYTSVDDILGVTDPDSTSAGVLVSAEYGQFSGAYSAIIAGGDLGAQQLVLGADFDVVEVGFFYADEDLEDVLASEQYALTVAGSFAGFEIMGSYGTTDYGGLVDVDAYGIEVAYPVGAVTLGAYYTAYDVEGEDVDGAYGVSVDYADGPITLAAYYGSGLMFDGTDVIDDGKEYGIEGAYDFGMGLVVTAGYIDGDDETDDDLATYIVAEYDLGGGATFLASYADANSDAAKSTDDIDTGVNGYELYSGATMAISFEF